MAKYVVVDGKHDLGVDKNGQRQYARKGDVVDMSPEQAARFPGKFKIAEPIVAAPQQAQQAPKPPEKGEEREEEE